MVARQAKSFRETIALLTEMERKMKLVEDVTGEEVSDMQRKSAKCTRGQYWWGSRIL